MIVRWLLAEERNILSNNTAILSGETGEVSSHLLQEVVTNPNYRKFYVLGRESQTPKLPED